ncbi:MAG TPA: preprotein translocase subunit Sec61beta [Candidatus Altiarchaeales archaeon]|nr:preprotein translocase subunit Sec61beta [Candidatus Altiarchaeales archaeon]
MPSLKKKGSEGPAGGAGLIRYFDVDEGGYKINPKALIGLVIAVIVLEILSKIILE